MLSRGAVRVHSLAAKRREAIGIPSRAYDLPVVVGICGGISSGKSTFCSKLTTLMGPDHVLVISQDDYRIDQSHLSPLERETLNANHPDTVEFDLLRHHLDELLLGRSVAVPEYDQSQLARISVQQIAESRPIILLEGSLIFSNRDIVSRLNRKIFIDTSLETRMHRRLQLEVDQWGRNRELVRHFLESRLLPAHDTYVEPFKNLADEIISGEKPFEPFLLEFCSSLLALRCTGDF